MTDLALRQAERDQDWERYSRLLDRAGYLRYEWFCGPVPSRRDLHDAAGNVVGFIDFASGAIEFTSNSPQDQIATVRDDQLAMVRELLSVRDVDLWRTHIDGAT